MTGLVSKGLAIIGGRHAVIGAGVAIGFAILQWLLVGQIYGSAEAVKLIEALKSASLYYGSAIATSSATILALMLTLLGVTRQSESDFDRSTYETIEKIGLISTIALCGAILMLLVLSMPVGEFKNLPPAWYPILYNVLAVMNAVLSGLLIGAVILLFSTIRHVIKAVAPQAEPSGDKVDSS